jgi:hypothetical protein
MWQRIVGVLQLMPVPSCERDCCCLLVLNTVTSTPQWIRQQKPCGCVFVFVCMLGHSRATQSPNLQLCLLLHFCFLTHFTSCHPDSQLVPS